MVLINPNSLSLCVCVCYLLRSRSLREFWTSLSAARVSLNERELVYRFDCGGSGLWCCPPNRGNRFPSARNAWCNLMRKIIDPTKTSFQYSFLPLSNSKSGRLRRSVAQRAHSHWSNKRFFSCREPPVIRNCFFVTPDVISYVRSLSLFLLKVHAKMP